jgi:hypothetical protein
MRRHMPIQIEIDGKIYTGHYTVCDGLITVSSDIGSKAKPTGRTPPRIIARWVLGELARESIFY